FVQMWPNGPARFRNHFSNLGACESLAKRKSIIPSRENLNFARRGPKTGRLHIHLSTCRRNCLIHQTLKDWNSSSLAHHGLRCRTRSSSRSLGFTAASNHFQNQQVVALILRSAEEGNLRQHAEFIAGDSVARMQLFIG